MSFATTPPLIGLGGVLGSGKDAAADYLVDQYGWVKIGMSDVLNEALQRLNPVVQPVYAHSPRYTDALKRYGYTGAKKAVPEVRRLLQAFGTEVGREMFGEDFWVEQVGRRIDALRAEGKAIAVTGIRFPNELSLISARGGTLVRVVRPSLLTPEVTASHASEASLSDNDFDVRFINDGALSDLYRTIDDYLQRDDVALPA